MSPTISSLGERALVDRLHQRVAPAPPFVRIGIGDDAAVLVPERGMQQVVTTDALVEGIHFRRDWTSADAIGHKALAVNLSDVAAMGATPRASLLSLALPADYPLSDFDALVDGYCRLAASSGAALVGGNLTRSPGPVMIDVTAMGSVRPRRLLCRSGARKGDELFVTGTLGAAAAGLALLGAGVARAEMDTAQLDCVARHERPEPRLKLGWLVGKTGAASAAIDLSDGLADGASRLADAAGLGIVLDGGLLPVAEGARAWAERTGLDPIDFALAGGEDYELAFAVPPRRRSRFLAAARRCAGLQVTAVGRFVREPGAWIEKNGQKLAVPVGFAHF